MSAPKTSFRALLAAARKKLKPGFGAIPDPALREALVREHGLDGMRVLFECEHPKWQCELHPLEAPGAPWDLRAQERAAVPVRALGPLAARLPRTTAMLAGALAVCLAEHTAQKGSPDLPGWFLVYALPGSYGPGLFLAGPPCVAPALGVPGWELPRALRELYAVHHGLGAFVDEFGWTGFDPGVQPAPLVASPGVDVADGAAGDLLRFTRGTGEAGEGGWCFARGGATKRAPARRRGAGRAAAKDTESAEEGYSVVELEDRFGTLGPPCPWDFWGFLDRYLAGDEARELPYAESY